VLSSRPNVWQLQSRRDIPALIAALDYADPEIRRRAAAALQALDAHQSAPALRHAFERETDPQTRSVLTAALQTLEHQPDLDSLIRTGDVSGLIEVLKIRQPEHAIAAAEALGRLGDRIAVEPLVILFYNSSAPAAVRLAAAEALLELKSAPAVVTLLGALRRDSWEVRRNAAAVLGQIQATWAVKPLAAALHDPNPIVRRTAAAALRRIGTVEAVAALRARYTREGRREEPAPVPAPAPAPLPEPELSAPSTKPSLRPPATQTTAPDASGEDDSAPTREPDPPAALPAQNSEDRAAKLTRPVQKLIAFLKARTADER
jgi:HEAT repeat protein